MDTFSNRLNGPGESPKGLKCTSGLHVDQEGGQAMCHLAPWSELEWGISQAPATCRMFWDVIQTISRREFMTYLTLIITFPCFDGSFPLAAERCIVPFLLNLN